MMDQTPFQHHNIDLIRKRRRSPEYTEDELSAAESLLLLSDSGGGFCRSPSTPTQKEPAASPNSVLPPAFPKSAHHCLVCGKVFPSHQTLGGHMTSHRLAAAFHANSAAGIHECSQCFMRFPSGQALGGHMRKHYQGPPLLRKEENRTAGNNNGGGSAKSVAPEFDLNLPAPEPEYYDDEVGF